GMAGGVLFPSLADPLAPAPKWGMYLFLFMCFIAVDLKETWRGIRAAPGIIFYLTAVKLLLLPVLLWGFFRLVFPEYALAGLLLGAAPIGVVVPVFAIILGVDFTLVLIGIAVTTLLLPITLPPLTHAAASFGGTAVLDLPLGDMTLSLAVTIFVPLLCAQLSRWKAPTVTAWFSRRRSSISTVLVFLTGLAIFSRYSGILRQDVSILVESLVMALSIAALSFIVTALLTRGFATPRRVAFVMSCTGLNNVLCLILSSEFFTVREALVSAFYQIPFFGFVIVYKLFLQYLNKKDAAASGRAGTSAE
ncbi:hypothetical protein LJC23_06120, partial [Desulfovibrio sp. OttesenSCG-928-I05]|nr:hypothetical protein [Desulfovibrio sp. OttesenSCG-928-I05]